MSPFEFKLDKILLSNPTGSYSTRAARDRILKMAGRQLHEMGFMVNNPGALKPKHAHRLVRLWRDSKLSAGTIKNRMSHLRWLGKTTNNRFMKGLNVDYGIHNRVYVSRVNRAVEFTTEKLDRIEDSYVRMSAELQKEFGLRREEAIKFRPSFADRITHIELKPSWTKGGRGRVIAIRTDAQRAVLQRAHHLAGRGNLIPANSSYYQQQKRYENKMASAGLGNSHGARHHYAQQRYKELTGDNCVHLGGIPRRHLFGDVRDRDTVARQIISSELGHSRIQIVAVYLGG